MLDQRDIEIGGERFRIGKLPTSEALKFGIIFGRIAGSILAGGLERDFKNLDSDPEEEEEGAKDDENVKFDLMDQLDISRMIEGLMEHMDERKVPALIQDLVEKSVALPKYSLVWFDTRFAGKLDELLELLTEIFTDNFGGVIETAKKKFQESGQTTSGKSSDTSEEGNGTSPTMEEESDPSFFDQSRQNTARSSRRNKKSPSKKSST